MNIDFHTHGKLAKKLPFSKEYTEWLFSEAVDAGLHAICLTEHFNTLGFEEVYEYIRDRYRQEGDCFVTNKGLKIFPGMEVDIAEGGHTLAIGDMDCILGVNRLLEPYKEKGRFMNAEEWILLAKKNHLLLGAGHPFREGGHIHELPPEILDQFDFIDRNGKDSAEDNEKNVRKLLELKKTIGKPIVAGSDTHQATQYGCIYNKFDKDCIYIKELLQEMQQGNYKIEVSPLLEKKVANAGILKRALKKVHEDGGDYVSLLISE